MAYSDVLEDCIAAMRNGAHFEHFSLAFTEAVAGELAKWTFRRALVGQDFSFKDHLRVCRDEEIGRFAFDELQRFAKQPTHDRALIFIDGTDGETAESDSGVNANCEGNGQR